ncbi:MAG: AMP-binding protein [Candidatus Omnitrophica bacterium]|nr:AMP-binding protein [Candidatus Omnitrophota bacterium]
MDEKLYTLPGKLREVVDQFADKIVMQMKKENGYLEYTYKEFYEASQAAAYFLLNAGIKKGDRVAIVLENRPEWGIIYFGIMLAGGIAVPLDLQSGGKEIKFFLSDSESKVAFTSSKLLSLFTGLTDSVPSLQKIIALDLEKSSEEIISFSETISAASDLKPITSIPEVSPQDIASILYTSGTTGRPKGVMLTHKNFYSNFQSIDKLKLFSDKDNVLSILPLHHSFPFMVTLIIPLFSQSKITYISSLKSEELLECMRETGVTILTGVPQLFYMFYKHILNEIKKIPLLIRMPLLGFIEILSLMRKFTGINVTKLALSKIHRVFGKKLRFFACGGAKLNEEVARFLVKIGFTILEGYGLTETSPVATFNPLKKQKIGSTGKVIPDVELRIAQPDEYGVGEVAIKGPNVMKGYYKQEEETRKVLKDNWFYSGDLGYLDRQGYLRLTGRKKELIVLSSGKNISPEEVESHYAKSPFIKGLCILAVGEREEEKLMAVIVPDLDYYRKAGEVNIYGMIKWDLENLSKQYPPYKRIRGFVVTSEDLPRTRLGKLKRFEIKDRYLDELMGAGLRKTDAEISPTDEDLKILSSGIGKKIIKTLSEETDLERQIRLDDHLEIDLGLDSLGRVELMVALEKILKIDIPDSVMVKIFTVRELILEIEKLILKKEPGTGETSVIQTRLSLWSDILKTNPAKDILEKIDLLPGWIARLFTLLVSGMLYIIFKLIWQVKVFGIKNLPPNEAFIFCPNHCSYLDGFLIAASTPRWLKKHMFFLGFRVYFEVPIIRNIVKLIRIIPIDPGAQLMDAMQACAYILRNGKTACIFPEGARSIDGEIKEFKKGVGILAKELSIRLIPVYIKGSYESWPRTKRFPRPNPVTIVFGKPHNAEELKKEGLKLGAKDDYEAITLGIREEVMRLKVKAGNFKKFIVGG